MVFGHNEARFVLCVFGAGFYAFGSRLLSSVAQYWYYYSIFIRKVVEVNFSPQVVER